MVTVNCERMQELYIFRLSQFLLFKKKKRKKSITDYLLSLRLGVILYCKTILGLT